MEDSDFEAFEGFEEAMAEMEKHRYDSMVKHALVRTVVVKHNKMGKHSWDKPVTILHTSIFELGLTNVGDRYAHNWLDDEWDTHGEGCVEWVLKDKPNGIYEIVGDLYYHGWESGYEEREYESELDVRDFKIQTLNYDQMCRFVDDEKMQEEEVHLTKLLDKESSFMDWDTHIHHYMDKRQILTHFANALCSIMSQFWGSARTNTKDMTVDELDVFIHMCMLEIDSKSEEKPKDQMIFLLAAKMDEEVKKTIEAHEAWFNEKS